MRSPEGTGKTVRDVLVEILLATAGIDDICDRHVVVSAIMEDPRLSISLAAAPSESAADPPRCERCGCAVIPVHGCVNCGLGAEKA